MQTTRRVRILFVNCPSLDTDAATYLLLSQNPAQGILQFETAHHWLAAQIRQSKEEADLKKRPLRLKLFSWISSKFALLPWIYEWAERKRRSEVDLHEASYMRRLITRQGWKQTIRHLVESNHELFENFYGDRFSFASCPTIVVTETRIEGGYFSLCDDDLSVISISDWNFFFRPSSALEFILAAVQRNALRLVFKNIGSHFPTRGCIWDFAAYKRDARIAAATGFLCDECRLSFSTVASQEDLSEIDKLISNSWIGHLSEEGSVASMLYNGYGYELSRSSGLRGGLWGLIRRGFRSEFGTIIVEVAKWVAVVVLSLLLVQCFPESAKLLGS